MMIMINWLELSFVSYNTNADVEHIGAWIVSNLMMVVVRPLILGRWEYPQRSQEGCSHSEKDFLSFCENSNLKKGFVYFSVKFVIKMIK